MVTISTRLSNLRESARTERFEPNAGISATTVQGAIEELANTGVGTPIGVLGIIGQSNALGHGSAHGPTVPTGQVLQVNSGSITDANDPVGTGLHQANIGSPWPSLGLTYYNATGRKIAFVPMAVDSSALQAAADNGSGNWSGTGTLRSAAITAFQQALTALTTAGYAPVYEGTLCILGETDALGINAGTPGVSQAGYTTELGNLTAALRTAMGAEVPFYICRIGTDTIQSDAGFAQIRAAIEAYPATDPYTFEVFTQALDFVQLGLMFNQIHYDTPGLNILGKVVAANIIAAQSRTTFQQGNSHTLYYNDGNVGIGTPVPDSLLTVNANVSQVPTAVSGTMAHWVAADAATARSGFDVFGAAGTVYARRADGTNASKSALADSEDVLAVQAFGTDSSGYVATPQASVKMTTVSSWTTTSHGCQITLSATPSGTTTQQTAVAVLGPGAIQMPGYGAGLAAFDGSGNISSTEAPILTTSLTVPLIFGGTAAGATLALKSTSNGSPSGDKVTISTGGTVRQTYLSNGNIGIGTESNPQSPLVASENATTGVLTTVTDIVTIVAADGSNAFAAFQAYNGGLGAFQFRVSTTTAALSSGTAGYPVANTTLGQITFAGWDQSGPSWSSAKAVIRGLATANWSGTDNSTYLTFLTTPTGSRTPGSVGRIMQGWLVGTGTADPGIGNASASGFVRTMDQTAIPAGGTQDAGYLFSSTAHFGQFFGSGAPTLSAAQGSLYQRSDGGVATRAYVNNNGSTGWDALPATSYVGVFRVAAIGVNFNSANTDTAVSIPLPPGISRWALRTVRISNASASISTATIGVFTGTGGTGQTIAANQAITVTASAADTNNNTMSLTPTNGTTMAYNDTTIQIRIGTAQGSAATADVIFEIDPLT